MKKLKQYISQTHDKQLSFLKEMIAADTSIKQMGIYGNEANGQKIVQNKLIELGAEIDSFEPDNTMMKSHPEFNSGHDYTGRPNLVGVIRGSGGGKSMLFNAHIDVVPAGSSENWNTPAFEPTVEEGRLYGRGSCDMKAGGAAALMALSILKDLNIKLKGDVIYESVVDEEGGGNGTLACCLKGYQADAAIIPEPTCLKLMPAHMGWMFYRIEFSGKPLHCAYKWDGVNAIDLAVDFMMYMRDVERRWAITKRHPYLPSPTICFTVINGGDSSSTVPAHCTLDMTVHFHPMDSTKEKIGFYIEKALMNEIECWKQGSVAAKQFPPKIIKFQQGSAYDIGADHPIVKLTAKCINNVIGGPAQVEGLASGADARLLVNYGNTPTVICGPGSISVAHSANEYVPVDEYFKAVELFANVLIEWCGISE